MGFFDDDPFEDFVNEIFRGSRGSGNKNGRTIIQGENEDRTIDFIEGNDRVYMIFEMLGFNEKDIIISVKGNEFEINAKKQTPDNIQPYLVQKLNRGISIRKTLPRFINPKNFEYTMGNGILEITFKKSGGKR